MKPTPSKLVLLMSAAGLGLSWSTESQAVRDSQAPTSVSLSFGTPATKDPGCDMRSASAWQRCRDANGDVFRTIVAEASALPLPLATIDPPDELSSSSQRAEAVDATASEEEAHLSDDEPARNEPASPRKAPVAARGAEGPSGDSEVAPIELVVLDEPRALLPADVSAGAVHTGAQAAMAAAVGGPAVSTPQRAESIGHREEQPAEADSASIDRVFASLAEVLGAHLDAPAPRLAAQPAPIRAAPDAAAVTRHATAPAGEPAPRSDVLQRSSDAAQIVVAPSHTEKVLMNLAAVRSAEAEPMVPPRAQTKKTVVVRHTDKVLATLALFQSSKKKRAAWACTGDSDEEAGVAAVRYFRESADDAVFAGIGPEPDILLDLPAPQAERTEPLRAAPSPAASSPPALAAAVATREEHNAIGRELVALSHDKLDEVRGGFVTEGGLRISFGIERAVYLNGSLVATTSLNIADLSRISGGQAQVSGNATLAVLQSGSGNLFAPGSISTTSAGTVIQNTLDNQKINTITRIDAVVNSSSILRSISLESSMRSAIVNSLRR